MELARAAAGASQAHGQPANHAGGGRSWSWDTGSLARGRRQAGRRGRGGRPTDPCGGWDAAGGMLELELVAMAISSTGRHVLLLVACGDDFDGRAARFRRQRFYSGDGRHDFGSRRPSKIAQ